jgi:hypothetical protein
MEEIVRRANRKLKQPDEESLEELLKATQGTCTSARSEGVG